MSRVVITLSAKSPGCQMMKTEFLPADTGMRSDCWARIAIGQPPRR
jgi:hypothetical protein